MVKKISPILGLPDSQRLCISRNKSMLKRETQHATDDMAKVRAWFSLLGGFTDIERHLRRVMAGSGLNLPRFDILLLLSHHAEGLNMSELAKQLDDLKNKQVDDLKYIKDQLEVIGILLTQNKNSELAFHEAAEEHYRYLTEIERGRP